MPHRLDIAARRVSRRVAEIVGLTRAEFTVLVTLGQHAVLSPSSIGALANLDKVKVSRATAGLTARGLVRHSCDPSDQRVCRLRLTRQGSAYRRTLPALRAVEASLTGQVSQAGMAHLRPRWSGCRPVPRLWTLRRTEARHSQRPATRMPCPTRTGKRAADDQAG